MRELQEEFAKQARISEAGQRAEELAIMAEFSRRRKSSEQDSSEGTDVNAGSSSGEPASQSKCAVGTWASLKGMSKAHKLEVIRSAVENSPISGGLFTRSEAELDAILARVEQDLSKAFRVQSILLTENN